MNIPQKTPWWFWAIAIVALLWNAGGVMSYMSTELGYLEKLEMPAEQLEYYYGFPAWAVATWALGVWGAFLGSVLLLFRSRFAVALYGISIIGLVGTTYYQRVASQLPESLNTSGQTMFAVAIWLITFALLFFAMAMRKRGILR